MYTRHPKAHPSTFSSTLPAVSGPSSILHPKSCTHSPLPFLPDPDIPEDGPGTSVGGDSITDGPGVLGPVFGTGSQADGILGPGRHAPLGAVQLQSCSGVAVPGAAGWGQGRGGLQCSLEARPFLSPSPRHSPLGQQSSG